jgi:hypothetical protein
MIELILSILITSYFVVAANAITRDFTANIQPDVSNR